MRSFGCIRSELIGNEFEINPKTQLILPERYYLPIKTRVFDQGNKPICVSVSLCDMIYYQSNYLYKNLKLDLDIFWKNDINASKSGMQPKNALELLVKDCIPGLEGLFSIYAKIPSLIVAKQCIFQFGPIMICLPAKSTRDEFWHGENNYGGHAVIATGWNREGFLIKNSWGIDYGDGGYIIFPYEDFDLIYESWCIIK